MNAYLDLVRKVLETGELRPTRARVKGVPIYARSLFGQQLRFDLRDRFPLVTTKRVFWRGVVAELLWMLSGDTNVRALQRQGVHIWDAWADAEGNLGPVYGAQWRGATVARESSPSTTVDQVRELVEGLQRDPFGRRHVVSAWQPNDLARMALPPCHMAFQCYVSNDYRLSMMVTQRSADVFLGLPFNIAAYALLTHLLAHSVEYRAGELVFSLGDVHLYTNHEPQVMEQLQRAPLRLPYLSLNPEQRDLFALTAKDIELRAYQSHGPLPGDVAV